MPAKPWGIVSCRFESNKCLGEFPPRWIDRTEDFAEQKPSGVLDRHISGKMMFFGDFRVLIAPDSSLLKLASFEFV